MKKLTAAISAAAIAAAMAVPITAGAATTDFVFDFNSAYTKGDAWAALGGTGTNQEKIETARDAATGKLAIQKTDGSTLYQIQKSGMGLTGAYTISFDLTIPTAGNVNQFVCELKDNNGKTIVYKTNYFYSSTKSEALVKYNLSSAGDVQLAYTDSGNVRLSGEKEYTVTISMEADGSYSITTVPAEGSDFFNAGKAANTITGKFENYSSTENLRFFCADTASAAPYYIDNIRLTTASQPATAKTSKVTAAINGSVQIGGTEVTGATNDSIVVGDKYITFYRTDVTKGAKDVSAVTLRPTEVSADKAVSVDVDTTADGTASFYSAVIGGSDEITNWTYDFTYVD